MIDNTPEYLANLKKRSKLPLVTELIEEIESLRSEKTTLLNIIAEVNRDAWSDDKTRLRTIARTTDQALNIFKGKYL